MKCLLAILFLATRVVAFGLAMQCYSCYDYDEFDANGIKAVSTCKTGRAASDATENCQGSCQMYASKIYGHLNGQRAIVAYAYRRRCFPGRPDSGGSRCVERFNARVCGCSGDRCNGEALFVN